ncbi:hypothetical protein Tco_0167616 [Tanacetum coccineum]
MRGYESHLIGPLRIFFEQSIATMMGYRGGSGGVYKGDMEGLGWYRGDVEVSFGACGLSRLYEMMPTRRSCGLDFGHG